MIGVRKSAIDVSRTVTTARTEAIKKVDIDIFKTGETTVSSYSYKFKENTVNTPINLIYIDSDTGYMRFYIGINGVTKVVVNLVLDAKTKISPQLVTMDGESRYEFGFKLTETKGSHFLTLKVGNVAKDADNNTRLTDQGEAIIASYENYTYNFQVIPQEKSQSTAVDIPVDSYRDALLNVTKLWLLSRRYDRVRQPDWAGFFDNHLREYKMNDEGAEKVATDLNEAIRGKIEDILITDIVATPHLESRSWDVSVTSTDTQTQLSTFSSTVEEKKVSISTADENVSNVKTVQI